EEALRIARTVRQILPETVIALGGTAPSEEPMAFFDPAVDFIGYRAGDRSLPALIQELRQGEGAPKNPAGFYYKEDGAWRLGPAATSVALSELKPYGWNSVPRHYWKHYYQAFRTTGMGLMSEGCPYDCNFCSVWITHGRNVQMASLDNLKHDFES